MAARLLTVGQYAAAALLAAFPVLTQVVADAAAFPKRVPAVASERYDRGALHRLVFGAGYRDLWKAPIELPVLDLEAEGGGLTPTRRFGGLQTAVLGFRGEDGRAYTFRGVDKDPSGVLDPELYDTIVHRVVRDQMAAQHPGGALAASVISEAAGVVTLHERMVVMPDAERLGAFRKEFGGMVGTFFEFPQAPGPERLPFQGAREIIDHEGLYERLQRGEDDAVDVEAFLRARLLDLLLGDFDRHRKQWRWARLPGDERWQPVPEDRDMAFVRFEGIGPRIGSLYAPILQRYGPEYRAIRGLMLHGWEQDRWLLPHLEWPRWESVALDLRQRISDAVIDQAVAALPPEYVALDGEPLRLALRGRRDRLPEAARSFYEHLAQMVDVQASDRAEVVSIQRLPDGPMRVEVRRGEDDLPAFAREFEPEETDEVRLYLRDGDDRVTVTGEPGPILLRVIAGAGHKRLDDSDGGGTRLYDATGSLELTPGRGTRVDERPYQPPPSDAGFVDVENVPPRDWGSDFYPVPIFGFESDVGAFLGLGGVYTRYGFRKHPWASRHEFSAGYATEARRARLRYAGTFRNENSNLLTRLDLRYSGIEILRFFGIGNRITRKTSGSFFRARNQQLRMAPSLHLPLQDGRLRLSAGPWVEHSRTQDGQRLVNLLDPYGAGGFGSVGVFGRFQYDTRGSLTDHANLALPLHENPAAGHPTRGMLLDVNAQLSPPVWDVKKTWGFLEGSLAGFVSAGRRATLGARVGGKRTFGRTPYYAAAYVGGGEFFSGGAVVRGYRAQRFGGRGSLYANLDLRIFLLRTKLVVPGDFGVLMFGDVGRVWVDPGDGNIRGDLGAGVAFLSSRSAERWHPSFGGGIWFAPLTRTNTLSLSVASGPEDTLFYMRVGFHY